MVSNKKNKLIFDNLFEKIISEMRMAQDHVNSQVNQWTAKAEAEMHVENMIQKVFKRMESMQSAQMESMLKWQRDMERRFNSVLDFQKTMLDTLMPGATKKNSPHGSERILTSAPKRASRKSIDKEVSVSKETNSFGEESNEVEKDLHEAGRVINKQVDNEIDRKSSEPADQSKDLEATSNAFTEKKAIGSTTTKSTSTRRKTSRKDSTAKTGVKSSAAKAKSSAAKSRQTRTTSSKTGVRKTRAKKKTNQSHSGVTDTPSVSETKSAT